MFVKNLPSFKMYKNVDDLHWVITNHRKLVYEMIIYHINKGNKISTIKSAITAIMRIIYLATGNKSNHLYRKYKTIQDDTGAKIVSNEGDNKLNSNEETRFIDWNNVLVEQKAIQDKFDAISNKKSVVAYDINQDLLLISYIYYILLFHL